MYFAGIFLVSLLSVILGWVWYSPLLFGKKWKKLQREKPTKTEPKIVLFFLSFFPVLITASILRLFLTLFSIQSWTTGMFIGFLCWFGFVTATQFMSWTFSGKKMGVFLIDTSYQLLSYLLMGALLTFIK